MRESDEQFKDAQRVHRDEAEAYHRVPAPTVADMLPLILAQQEQKNTLRWQLITGLRQLVVAVLTSAIIVGGLIIGFAGQTATEQRVLLETKNANLAIACVLALPVTDKGRDVALVELCFTQYGLRPPALHN